MKSWKKALALVSIVSMTASVAVGCGGGQTNQPAQQPSAATEKTAAVDLKSLKGAVTADGSSTVFPLTEAVAEEFRKVAPNVKVTVGVSGTGGGFKKFGSGETDISNASRPIKKEEAEAAQKNNVTYKELQVAIDGLSVIVNKDNDFVDYLTVEELKKIWEPNSKVTKWSDVRPNWPAQPIKLYGPGHDSGTFDYFTEAINGKGGASRPDYTASEDDNVLVKGVTGDKYALGYFGYSYYEENKAKLKAVPIDGGNGKGPVAPTLDTIIKGDYAPLARPIFIYVKEASLQKPEAKEFVKFYVDNMNKLSKQIGMIPLPENKLAEQKAKLK